MICTNVDHWDHFRLSINILQGCDRASRRTCMRETTSGNRSSCSLGHENQWEIYDTVGISVSLEAEH